MRLGCGCAVVLIGLAAGVCGAAWIAVAMLQTPDLPQISETVPPSRPAPRGGHERGGRTGTLTLSEVDATAIVAQRLAAADVPITDARVSVPDAGVVDVAGRVALHDLLREPPLSAVSAVLPRSWLAHRVWIVVRAVPRVERPAEGSRRRYLRLDVTRFAVGRAPLPSTLFRVLFDPATVGLLRWRLPESVEEITPERGRVTIRIAS